ncbi:MAG TPA: HAMP domain-containing sensor histidine kinase [Gaiellaceae bacterium]|jgi:signal transduction histidine kinase
MRRPGARDESLLVRAVGRAPVGVRTKLLVAFAGLAALLVVVAVLGLRVLGQSNARVASLGTLQLRAAAYQALQAQAQQLRQLLSIRAAQDPNLSVYVGVPATYVRDGRRWTLVDLTISAALSQLLPATNEANFGFVPGARDKPLLRQVARDFNSLERTLHRITVLDGKGAPGSVTRPLLRSMIDDDNDLGFVTDRLATETRARTDAVIAQSSSAYTSSRDLFIGVGAGSVGLALLLGLVLSLSVVGPIRRTEARLAEIAAGDFSRHVDVGNRDELGALATNLNRMNDELRRLYEELETTSRHKSEFLATVSHELRTPLNAIIGFSEVLHEQMFGELNEQQLGYTRDVLESGRHLLALINDLLDLSKVEAGRMELDVSRVSLRTVLESGITVNAEIAARRGVELRLTVHPDEITLEADERKLRQVVFNLLSNAVKFTPAGGIVDVSAARHDGRVAVAVADTGPGIDPHDAELIFEDFRRAESAEEGTGLGLPLARRFVELHGGRLWLESAVGGGSTFRFELPVTQREAAWASSS